MFPTEGEGRQRAPAAQTLFLACALLVSACSSAVVLYQGPKRPRQQVARLFAGYGTKIIRVDDHSCSHEDRIKKYDVLPGQHAISLTTFAVDHYVLMSKTTWTMPTTVCLEAQAGHDYTFDRDEALGTFRIVDLTANKHVAGVDCPARYDERDVEEWNQRPW